LSHKKKKKLRNTSHLIILRNTNIEIIRRQFPIALAYKSTNRKGKRQKIGIDNRDQVFSHGQLFIALSRTDSIVLLIDQTKPPGSNNQWQTLYQNNLLTPVLDNNKIDLKINAKIQINNLNYGN